METFRRQSQHGGRLCKIEVMLLLNLPIQIQLSRTEINFQMLDQPEAGLEVYSQLPKAKKGPVAAIIALPALWALPALHHRSVIPDPEYDWNERRKRDNRFIRYGKNEYKPGMIIRAPLHEQDSKGGQHRPNGTGSSVATMASEATKAERYTTESRFGTIFTKHRKMIVVALHQDNYVAVPMYTHNGMGLVNKARPDEFVSIKDHRDKNDADWRQLSKWDPLVTEHLKEGIDLFDPKSTVHVAYPF
ncbi:MAG: hypothetical protein LQ350_001942 [Teloschistes chrysophthalmus]|nr:MAG: hypothetical protein LQ350_001942 [Niorma chrysophthalma]